MSEQFNKLLIKTLQENKIMSTKEIYSLFFDMNNQTVSWHLHRLQKLGTIVQVSHGCYALPSDYPKDDEQHLSQLPEMSKIAYKIVSSLGYKFYFSGLDALKGKGFSIEGGYPVIICVEPDRTKDVQLELMRQCDFAITEDEFDLLESNHLKDSVQFYILKSSAYELSDNHFACSEKAFVDLYYAITRLDYPIAVQTLPHVLGRIKSNEFKFRKATRDRGLSEELNFLTCYNKEFLKEFSNILNK